MLLVLGAVIMGAASKLLKRLLRMPRPAGARQSDYGMPSSHATLLMFLARGFARLMLPKLGWAGPLPTAASMLLPFCVAMLRWLSGEHTAAQVGVGAALGLVSAELWHAHVLADVVRTAQPLPGIVVSAALAAGAFVVYFKDFRRRWYGAAKQRRA